jgi:hypothetical protein
VFSATELLLGEAVRRASIVGGLVSVMLVLVPSINRARAEAKYTMQVIVPGAEGAGYIQVCTASGKPETYTIASCAKFFAKYLTQGAVSLTMTLPDASAMSPGFKGVKLDKHLGKLAALPSAADAQSKVDALRSSVTTWLPSAKKANILDTADRLQSVVDMQRWVKDGVLLPGMFTP